MYIHCSYICTVRYAVTLPEFSGRLHKRLSGVNSVTERRSLYLLAERAVVMATERADYTRIIEEMQTLVLDYVSQSWPVIKTSVSKPS